MLSSAKSPHRYRLTADDYHRMGEAGIFAEEDRVELIEGEIIEMAPIGCSHSGIVLQLSEMLTDAVGRKALVSVQNPIAIGPHSEPQPDIALLKRREDFYKSAHPHPADVLLIIEVADTSLAYDRDVSFRFMRATAYPRFGSWISKTDACTCLPQLPKPVINKLRRSPIRACARSGLCLIVRSISADCFNHALRRSATQAYRRDASLMSRARRLR